MKFADFAPPVSPSLEQQRDALQKGLGRAMQWALTGRLQDEPLLEAGLKDQRYDSQIDGPRGDWLWEMIRAVGGTDRFRVPILHALYELSDERSAVQRCELARCYSMKGDHAFRSRLYEIVERNPFPNHCPGLGEEEIITLDGEQAFLFAARMRGGSLANREWEWEDGSLIRFAVERFSETRVRNLLEASSDAEICRFREGWQSDERRMAGLGEPISNKQRMAAISVEKIFRAAEGEDRCYWFRGWGRHANEADLRTILQRLWSEQEPQVLVKLLRVFSGRALPDFNARLIDLCRHDDEEVQLRAFCALEQNTHPLIREFALTELHRGTHDRFVIGLFINNYQLGDELRILEAMEIPEDADELHWLLRDVLKILEKNPAADGSQLGVVCYALTPCASCRCDAAQLLVNRQVAPEWLKEECRHDSGEDCRAAFVKTPASTA